MEQFRLSDYNLKTKLYWCAMLCVCLFALSFAGYKVAEFSLLQFAVLGVSLVISLLVNKYQIKIPNTQTSISAKELVVFWGIIWLGIPGGILLAASASLARFDKAKKSQNRWLFGVFVNTFSAFVAAIVFYLSFYYLAGFTTNAVAENAVAIHWLLVATSLTAFTHFWLLRNR